MSDLGAPHLGPELALAAADPRLGHVIDRIVADGGPLRARRAAGRSHLEALARAIVYQQLSGRAAETLYGRFRAHVGEPTAEGLAARTVDELRAVGVSRAKALALLDLGQRAARGELDLAALDGLDDEAVVEALVRVRGIGEWTARVFLLFHLERPDVLPATDLGIRRGVAIAHGLRRDAAVGYVERVGRRWAPNRSIASLYLWAAVDRRLAPTPREVARPR